MKRILLLTGILVSLAALQIVFAQGTEGVITFETKINMHRRLPPNQESMKSMIPEFRTTKQELYFNANESLQKPVIEDEDEETSGSSGGMHVRMRVPNEEVYTSPPNSSWVTQREFMGKEYLIVDTIKVSPWKFGTEVKEILGYACKQAYFTDESQADRKLEVTAWYTDKIRPMLGPDRISTLPGAVLAVDINNGERVVVARKIELGPLRKNEIKIPSRGEKKTQKEFRSMVDEQQKKMGGGGNIIIRN